MRSWWVSLSRKSWGECYHYCDVIMGAVAPQITSLMIVYSTVYSDANQRKHQSSASLAFVRGIHREPLNSPHKWPVMRKMFPFDDVIMYSKSLQSTNFDHKMIIRIPELIVRDYSNSILHASLNEIFHVKMWGVWANTGSTNVGRWV